MRSSSRPQPMLNEQAVQLAPSLRQWRRRSLMMGCAMLAFLGWPAWAAPSNEASVESQVKAAFLYKFGAYVDWPAQVFERPDTPFTIGVIGSDSFVSVLSQIATGRDVNGRVIEVRKLQRGGPMSGVHIVFVAQSDDAVVAEILSAVKGQAVLTVTENDKGLLDGSMINFVLVGDKVRFDIALPVAEQSNLKISAKLLGVARKIVTKPS